MLVLNRKNGEEIKIGKDIKIKIVWASEGGVKIGIEAPPHIPILREELYANIKENVIEATEQSKVGLGDTQTLQINKLRVSDNE